MAEVRYDLARITLAVLCIASLIGASLWILRPFLPAVIWAATLVIATWSPMCRLQRWLWNSRALAATTMTLALLLVFVLPFWLAIRTIAQNTDQIVRWAGFFASAGLRTPPPWLVDIPLVGPTAARFWQDVAGASLQEILEAAKPYAGEITQWFISGLGGFGLVFVQFLLTVALSAIMYAKGERAAAELVRFGSRLAGARGEQSVWLAAQAIRGVALGVVVTALIQSAIGGIGLAIAGVPFASVLSAVMFMLCIAQIGPAPVLLPAVIWMFVSDHFTPAVFLLVCSLVALGIDNFVRPILIRKGADLPLLLILAGVIGGLIAFGLIGIFLGPTILAVGYRLLQAWVAEADSSDVESETAQLRPGGS